MPLSALLLAAVVAAPEPAAAPREQAAIMPAGLVRATSIAAGPSLGSLYGLRLAGGGSLHVSYGETFDVAARGGTWGWDLGGGLGRSWTPAGLAVTDVAVDFALHMGWGPARLGAGAELRVLDVERKTSTDGALRDVRLDPIAFLSVDAFRVGRATAFLEARAYGIATLAWSAQVMAGVRL
jgi:hypothetical protein